MNIKTKISTALAAAGFALVFASGASAATHHMKSAHHMSAVTSRTTQRHENHGDFSATAPLNFGTEPEADGSAYGPQDTIGIGHQ